MILIAVLVFGVIFARVIMMPERAEVRTEIRPESGEPVTQGTGIRGLRGSLP